MEERIMPNDENEEVLRCRRVRHELYARFKTAEEMHAWLREREKQGGHRLWYRSAKAQVCKKVKPHARNRKPANGKPEFQAQ